MTESGNEIKETVAWETTDGKVFSHYLRHEASEHQKALNFGIFYDNNRLYSCSDAAHVFEWLKENSEKIKKFLD